MVSVIYDDLGDGIVLVETYFHGLYTGVNHLDEHRLGVNYGEIHVVIDFYAEDSFYLVGVEGEGFDIDPMSRAGVTL